MGGRIRAQAQDWAHGGVEGDKQRHDDDQVCSPAADHCSVNSTLVARLTQAAGRRFGLFPMQTRSTAQLAPVPASGPNAGTAHPQRLRRHLFDSAARNRRLTTYVFNPLSYRISSSSCRKV